MTSLPSFYRSGCSCDHHRRLVPGAAAGGVVDDAVAVVAAAAAASVVAVAAMENTIEKHPLTKSPAGSAVWNQHY